MDTRKITRERLQRWSDLLAQQNATPVLLIGVGHGGEFHGQPVLCLTEDMPNDQAALFLATAAKALLEINPPNEKGRFVYDVKKES